MPKKEQEAAIKTLPIEWVVPETVTTAHVTNMVVQQSEHEIVISLFEVRKPVIVGDPNTVAAKMASLDKVPAICVARVAVSPERFSTFVEVFKQVEKRRAGAKHGESEEVV